MPDKKALYSSVSFKKDRLAWGFAALIIAACVFGFKLWQSQDVVTLKPWGARVTNQPYITILHYDAVVPEKNGENVYRAQFVRQLDALEKNGFTIISLSELKQFYYDGLKLPKNSLLLTFDHGYLETYSLVDAVLRERHIPATVSISLSVLERKSTTFLYWDRLQKMVDSGIWDIASSGQRIAVPLTLDETGRVGHFLANRIKLAQTGRYENDLEYARRVADDLSGSRAMMERNLTNYKILAFSFSGNLRKTIGEPESIKATLKAIRSHYPLGFADSFSGVNTRESDPHTLKRLKVKADWTAQGLIHRFTTALNSPTHAGPSLETPVTTAWFDGEGNVIETSGPYAPLPGEKPSFVFTANSDRGIQLQGDHGAEIWIPGGRWAVNWTFEADIYLESGQFWIRQDSSKEVDEWRFGGNEDGLKVQYRRLRQPFNTLSASPTPLELKKWQRLSVTKRGAGIWAEINGRPLWKHPVYLPGNFLGNIGLIGWSDEGRATFKVSNAKFSYAPYDIRWIGERPTAGEIHKLKENFKTISAITTLTQVLHKNQVVHVDYDHDFYSLLTHRFGWKFIPTLRIISEPGPGFERITTISAENSGPPQWLSNLMALVNEYRWEIIHIDLSQQAPKDQKVFSNLLPLLEAYLHKAGCQLLVSKAGQPSLRQSFRPQHLEYVTDE